MTRERLYLFDTTLRDGAQTQGVDFSVHDKQTIAQALDRIGVDYVEGGWPGANPTDTSFFAAPPALKRAKLIAFGMTKRSGRSAANDPGLAQVLDATSQGTCLVGKGWDFHVTLALGIPLEENLGLIRESIAAAVARGGEAMFDAEHFFDGYKANPAYAIACLKAAEAASARWLVLCDTNGGSLPHEVERIVGEVVKELPGGKLGIHAHNDTENAVANSLAAIRAGVRQVQGTLNGLGERCGNANLGSLIPSLMLKPPYAERFEIGVGAENLRHLTQLSRQLDEMLNRAPNRHAAYVGASAFAHKAGLHVAAVEKDPRTYEHIPPERVGNQIGDADPRPHPPRRLCRRLSLRPQGRAACRRRREGSADLRAHPAGEGGQSAPHSGLRPGWARPHPVAAARGRGRARSQASQRGAA